jgi:hypothetical protein
LAGWHLKSIKISTSRGKTYRFPCDKWLDRNEDDGVIERILHPAEGSENSDFDSRALSQTRKSKKNTYFIFAYLKALKLLQKKTFVSDRLESEEGGLYIVTVNTSNLAQAGTDAKVYLIISGSNFKTERIFLRDSKTHRNVFEKGNSDVFELNLPGVGAIEKIRYFYSI